MQKGSLKKVSKNDSHEFCKKNSEGARREGNMSCLRQSLITTDKKKIIK